MADDMQVEPLMWSGGVNMRRVQPGLFSHSQRETADMQARPPNPSRKELLVLRRCSTAVQSDVELVASWLGGYLHYLCLAGLTLPAVPVCRVNLLETASSPVSQGLSSRRVAVHLTHTCTCQPFSPLIP